MLTVFSSLSAVIDSVANAWQYERIFAWLSQLLRLCGLSHSSVYTLREDDTQTRQTYSLAYSVGLFCRKEQPTTFLITTLRLTMVGHVPTLRFCIKCIVIHL